MLEPLPSSMISGVLVLQLYKGKKNKDCVFIIIKRMVSKHFYLCIILSFHVCK